MRNGGSTLRVARRILKFSLSVESVRDDAVR